MGVNRRDFQLGNYFFIKSKAQVTKKNRLLGLLVHQN